MPNQTKGPKVQRVDRAAREKAEKARARQEQKRRKAEENAERRAAAKEEKERKRAAAREAKAAKAQELAVNKAEKVAQKALKTQSKADAKDRKRSLRAETKAKKALKKGHAAAETQEEALPVPEAPANETVAAEGLAEAVPLSEGAGAAGAAEAVDAAEIPSGEGAGESEDTNDGKRKKKKTKKSKKVKERPEMTPQEKKKGMIFLVVIVVLVLLIVVSTFFLLRMILGDGRKAEASSSAPEVDSSSISMNVGTAGGSQVEDTQSDAPEDNAPEDKESASSSEKDSSSSKKEEKPKGEKSSSEEQKSSAKEDKKEKPKKEQSPDASSAQDASTDTAEPVNVLEQAIAGAAGTAEITAMFGSGAVPPDQVEYKPDTPMDNPKPGQPVPKEKPKQSEAGKDEPKKPSADSPEDDKPSALTSTTETQKVDNFKFSEASLSLPPYQYRASTGLEAAVHRDIGAYLDKKDDRPGVQITAVVMAGTVPQANGGLRVLAYSWGSRYAIADNTLFDYGNLVGPCALDYSVAGGQYVLQKITLARGGDAFEASVREMCGDQERIADRMVKKSYDLELRGQMLRNVSSYIQQNRIPVDFFRASGQVYNKDGSIYLPPGTEPEPESQPEETASTSTESADGTESSLVEDYRVIQDMPE